MNVRSLSDYKQLLVISSDILNVINLNQFDKSLNSNIT